MAVSRELVVARYEEDIEWTGAFKGQLTVYNKGDSLRALSHGTVKTLPNKGREAHTMLFHIVNRYDSLADHTIFAQGGPFEHSPDFLALINTPHSRIQPLSAYYMAQFVPPPRFHKHYRDYYLGEKRVYLEYISHNLLPMLPEPYLDVGLLKFILPNFRKGYPESVRAQSIAHFLWDKFGIKESLPKLLPFSFASQISLPKEAILRHPRATYERMLEWSTERPYNAHIAERLWLTIFGYHLQEPEPRYKAAPVFWRENSRVLNVKLLSRQIVLDALYGLRVVLGSLYIKTRFAFILMGRALKGSN